MEDQELTESLKLNITLLSNDRSREVVLKPLADQPSKQERQVTIWTRKLDITERVFVEESPHGGVRAVKRVAWRDKTVADYRSELVVLGRLSKAAGVQRKHFVEFLGWFTSPLSDHIYFVMEYCPLGDISQCYPDPLPEALTWSICEQLLEALSILHELGITHRDVKPQNVLVVRETPIWIKLADFGISKLTQEDETELRTRIGTDGYMAPEIFGLLDDSRESSSYTSAVDIWSLGCLLYYVLTKRTPFSTFLSLQAYTKGDATFPERPLYEKCVSLSGRAFIQRLLWPSPEARPRASKQLLANWISDVNAKPGATSALDPPNNVVRNSATQPLSPTNSSSTYGMGPTCPAGQEMGYFSFELWNLINNTRSLTETLEVNAGIHRQYMLDNNLNINWNNVEKATVFADYLVENDRLPKPSTDRLRTLLDEGANPNVLHNGYTAFHLATMKGHVEWVTILLDYGADMKIRTEKRENSVLHLAASQMCHRYYLAGSRLLDFFLDQGDQGADPNPPNVVGCTLLHELVRAAACHKTKSHVLDLISRQVGNLLKRGVSTEHKNRTGHTPLSYAIMLGLGKMASLLLESGSRPDTTDFEGRTPLHLAVASDKVSAELVGQLIKAGANVNQKDIEKHSPLFVAARNDVGGDVINLLLDCGAEYEFDDASVMRRVRRAKFWRKMKTGLLKSA